MPKYRFTEIAINSTEKKKPTEADKETYIGLEHLDSGTLTVSRWGSEVAPIGEKILMKKGDVLFGKRRAYQKKVGIAPFDGIFSAHGMVLRPREEVITKEYFPLFISSDYFLNEAIRISVGSLSPTVNWKDLKDLTFNIPTIEEQRRITPLVWAAIKAKNAYKTLIQRTDDLVKSQFIEMFGDEVKQVRLGELCLHFGDGDWIESKDQSEEGIRLIQTGNVGNGEYKDKDDKARYISEETFARLGCTEVFPGDILISRLPDPIGRACIVPEMPKSITAVDCTIVRLKDEILSTFFVNFTKTPMYTMQIDSFTTGSTRKRISRANLGSIMVPVPDLARQERFVLIAEQSDKSKFVVSNRNLSRCFMIRVIRLKLSGKS